MRPVLKHGPRSLTAISDTLVGAVLFPIFSIQLLYTDLLQNCAYDYMREYITTVTIGSSLMTLGVVSYDRYILMTKVGKHKKIMSPRRVGILIALSWIFPAVSPALRFLGKGPFLYCVIVITLGPLIILLFTYYRIMKCIQQSSARIGAHKRCESDTPDISEHLRASRSRNEKKNIRLARSVSVLILAYCVCLVPSSIWSINDLLNDSFGYTRPQVIQNLYVFACFAGSMNSCCNPIIYFFKQPGIQKGVYKLFNIKRSALNSSSTNGLKGTGPKSSLDCSLSNDDVISPDSSNNNPINGNRVKPGVLLTPVHECNKHCM